MRRWPRILGASAIACLALASQAGATPPKLWPSSWVPGYASAHLGGYVPDGSPGHLGRTHAQFEFGGCLGIEPRPFLDVELDFSSRNGTADTLWLPPALPNGGTYDATQTLESTGLSLSGKLFRSWYRFAPYVKGGAGLQWVSARLNGSWDELVVIPPLFAFTINHPVHESRAGMGASGHLAVGIDLLPQHGEELFWTVEARHTWFHADLDELSHDSADLSGWGFTLAVGTRFDPRLPGNRSGSTAP